MNITGKIKNKLEDVKRLIDDIDVNVSHTYGDVSFRHKSEINIPALIKKDLETERIIFSHFQGEYSLLFHCSVHNSLEIHQLLLDAGADPSWQNRAGNSVLNLYIKRRQVEMAEAAYKSLKDPEQQKAFVNQKSNNGKF